MLSFVRNCPFGLSYFCWNFFSFGDDMPQSAIDTPGIQKMFSAPKGLDV